MRFLRDMRVNVTRRADNEVINWRQTWEYLMNAILLTWDLVLDAFWFDIWLAFPEIRADALAGIT